MLHGKRRDYGTVLREIFESVGSLEKLGEVAHYIPALAKVDPEQYAMYLEVPGKENHGIGDVDTVFSIQSISKALSLAMVIEKKDELLWKRVGVEPSGNAFNSLIQLEQEKGKPRNPFINAGAIVVADELLSLYGDPKHALLERVRELAGGDPIDYDVEVAKGEMDTCDLNYSLAHFLKSHGNLKNKVEDVIEFYCYQCSLAMSAKTLARTFGFQCSDGVNPYNGRRFLTPSQSKRLNSIMLTCGFYDQAGAFAYQVGLPGKSGVGGGIVAVVPGYMSLAVWSPRLNKYGNSVLGIESLERFTTKTNLAIF